jgi:hypothetical protein
VAGDDPHAWLTEAEILKLQAYHLILKNSKRNKKTLHRKKKTLHAFHARLKKNFTIPTVGLVQVKGDKFTTDPLVNFSRKTSKLRFIILKKRKREKLHKYETKPNATHTTHTA